MPPACKWLQWGAGSSTLRAQGARRPHPKSAIPPVCPEPAAGCLGYSHVGLRGVWQGDPEVGDVLEDTRGREGTWLLWWRLAAHLPLTPVLPVGLPPPPRQAQHPLSGMVRRAVKDKQLVGRGGKQEGFGELGTVSPQCSRPGYGQQRTIFPCWEGCPAPPGPPPGQRGEVHVLWDAPSGKGDAAAGEGLQRSTEPYLQQGLGRFMDGNDVSDLVPAQLLQVFGIWRVKPDLSTCCLPTLLCPQALTTLLQTGSRQKHGCITPPACSGWHRQGRAVGLSDGSGGKGPLKLLQPNLLQSPGTSPT